ncbi:PEP-CTERM sorting domain-containing protein [Myxococcota bacterium]|nr:PEP-CTERM sorting domain-containing protein [Myxococcota bacterium]
MNSSNKRLGSNRDRTCAEAATFKALATLWITLLMTTGLAVAMPVSVFPQDREICDPLGLSPDPGSEQAAVDELGTVGFPDNETIIAQHDTIDHVACSSNHDPDGNDGQQVVVSIKNQTGLDFNNLWYVSDKETNLTNLDGIVDGQAAFKIDIDGINKPLVLEDLNPNGIFENAETWKFVIDGYFNSLGIPPSALESVGLVGNFSVSTASDNGRSSGSIIGTPVPEPTTGMLMGLGLAGISMAGRRRLRS